MRCPSQKSVVVPSGERLREKGRLYVTCTGRLCTMLIRRGARVDARDSLLSETPLHKAVRSNAIDNVSAILAFITGRSNHLRAADVAGNTALHKAAVQPGTDLAVWNMLLAALQGDASAVKMTNVDGASVLQVAQRAKNSVAQTVLRAFEAQIASL